MQLLRDNLTLWTSDLQDSKFGFFPLIRSLVADSAVQPAPQEKEDVKAEETEAPAPTGEEAA